MKRLTLASSLALLLLSIPALRTAAAQTAGPAANGTYQFSFEDRYVKYLEFDARALSGGGATGSMYFSDETKLRYQDVDGTGEPTGSYPGFYFKAALDGLVVDKNQAVMSGTIRDSSLPLLVGKRVLLTVEDNGDNTREPDRLTWGVYAPVNRDWKPSDAEWKDDPGVGMTWHATDHERRDDQGVKMPRSEAFECDTYPVASYAFADFKGGAGDIRVQP